MELVERVRLLCKERGIAISKIEKDLGYGNGYFNPKKLKNIPSDRLVEIAEYLGITVNELLEIEEAEIPEGTQVYYLDEETARIAQELKDNPGRRTLMDASRNMTPDQIKAMINMIESISGKDDFDDPC